MPALTVSWSIEVSTKFPDLAICLGTMQGVKVEEKNERISRLKRIVSDEVRARFRIETLKDHPTVRAYRDFYWKLGIDPTKTRPAGEALLRRVLHGRDLPTISTAVDAYNLGSLATIIPMSGFDKTRLAMPLHIRFARNGEEFKGIGKNKPVILTDKILVLADEDRVLCIYPYRDSDHTKVTARTRELIIVGYGAPGIEEKMLERAVRKTLSNVEMACGGRVEAFELAHARGG